MASITLEQLAQELETDPHRLRQFLRKNFPRKEGEAKKRYEWPIGHNELDQIRKAFRQGGLLTGPSAKRVARNIATGGKPKVRHPRVSAYEPEADQKLDRNCAWCGGQRYLVQVFSKEIGPREDQKIAVYQCDTCLLETEVVLTLPGWKAGVGYVN